MFDHFQVRNVEYKDPVEQEWEKFQREMQMENQVGLSRNAYM